MAEEELIERVRGVCPPGVRPSDVIRRERPALKCKGLKAPEFWTCLRREILDALRRAGCKV